MNPLKKDDPYRLRSQNHFERVAFDLDLPIPPEPEYQDIEDEALDERASLAQSALASSQRRIYFVRPDYSVKK